MAVEEIAKACASTALILMIQELGTLPIRLFGSEELKERFLPRCATRRVVAGVRAVGARGRLGSGRHAHPRRPRRRRVGDRRDQELDHQPRDRRLLRRVRGHRPRCRPFARDHRVRGRGRPARLQRRQARAQARDPRLADRPADLRRRPGAGGERDRRGQPGLQGRDGARSTARGSASPRRRSGSPRARPTTPPPTRASAGSSASRSTRSRAIQFKLADMETQCAAGARAALPGVREGRPRRPRPRQVLGDGEAVLLRRRR